MDNVAFKDESVSFEGEILPTLEYPLQHSKQYYIDHNVIT